MNTQAMSQMEELLQSPAALLVPALGEAIEGTVLSADRREVRIDIRGVMTGVVRGRELFAESDEFRTLKTGDTVEATVIDMENENGELELSFRYAGNRKAWEKLREAFTKGENAEVIVKDANKGGLLVTLGHIRGFLPVSQLSPDNYPRVSGGDKQKILEKLKTFVGQKFHVRVLDVNEDDEKLIVSEKALWEEKQQSKLTQYKVGSMIEGEVTALADFGAFVKFDALEGLVHISEIGWQRIDHPKDILKVGEVIKAEIIGIEGSKIFLSMKKLVADPWRDVEKKYAIGSTVEGKILKVNPFGFFVELDPDIHGLAHVSELSSKPVKDIESIGKEGDVLTFKIVSIEPKEHRLGLSLKALGAPADEAAPAEEVSEETK